MKASQDKVLFEKIVDTLISRKANFLITNGKSYSYDVIAKVRVNSDDRKLIIKISSDVDRIVKSEIVDLALLSKTANALPIIIGLFINNKLMSNDVVYRKFGIVAMSFKSLKNILNGKPIKFIKERGVTKAKVKGELLRKLREEAGLSLGDLAEMLGVNRKTVYEYERGTFEASERTAKTLMKIFGENILEDVELTPSTSELEKHYVKRKVTLGFIKNYLNTHEFYTLEKTHAKITAIDVSKGCENYLISDNSETKNELIKVAQILDVGVAITSSEKNEIEFIKEI